MACKLNLIIRVFISFSYFFLSHSRVFWSPGIYLLSCMQPEIGLEESHSQSSKLKDCPCVFGIVLFFCICSGIDLNLFVFVL